MLRPEAVIFIICDYYTLSKEELKKRKLLSAVDEAFVKRIDLNSNFVPSSCSISRSLCANNITLGSLVPGHPIDAKLMDRFFELIEYRSKNSQTQPDLPPAAKLKVGVLSAEFWSQAYLFRKFNTSWAQQCAARSTTALNMFDLDLVMFPIYDEPHNYYCLGVLNFSKVVIEVYQPMSRNVVAYHPGVQTLLALNLGCNVVRRYVQSEYKKLAPKMAFYDVWEVINRYADEEISTTLVDTGAAVCMLADYLAQGLNPDYRREAIPGFRLNIVRSIQCRTLE